MLLVTGWINALRGLGRVLRRARACAQPRRRRFTLSKAPFFSGELPELLQDRHTQSSSTPHGISWRLPPVALDGASCTPSAPSATQLAARAGADEMISNLQCKLLKLEGALEVLTKLIVTLVPSFFASRTCSSCSAAPPAASPRPPLIARSCTPMTLSLYEALFPSIESSVAMPPANASVHVVAASACVGGLCPRRRIRSKRAGNKVQKDSLHAPALSAVIESAEEEDSFAHQGNSNIQTSLSEKHSHALFVPPHVPIVKKGFAALKLCTPPDFSVRHFTRYYPLVTETDVDSDSDCSSLCYESNCSYPCPASWPAAKRAAHAAACASIVWSTG